MTFMFNTLLIQAFDTGFAESIDVRDAASLQRIKHNSEDHPSSKSKQLSARFLCARALLTFTISMQNSTSQRTYYNE